MESHWNLSFELASCFLPCVWCCSAPLDGSFLLFPERLNRARKGRGGSRQRARPKKPRSSLCVHLSVCAFELEYHSATHSSPFGAGHRKPAHEVKQEGKSLSPPDKFIKWEFSVGLRNRQGGTRWRSNILLSKETKHKLCPELRDNDAPRLTHPLN